MCYIVSTSTHRQQWGTLTEPWSMSTSSMPQQVWPSCSICGHKLGQKSERTSFISSSRGSAGVLVEQGMFPLSLIPQTSPIAQYPGLRTVVSQLSCAATSLPRNHRAFILSASKQEQSKYCILRQMAICALCLWRHWLAYNKQYKRLVSSRPRNTVIQETWTKSPLLQNSSSNLRSANTAHDSRLFMVAAAPPHLQD